MKFKSTLFVLAFFMFNAAHAQDHAKTKNVVVILIDGYRWQELFKGADFDLLNNKKYNAGDSIERMKKY